MIQNCGYRFHELVTTRAFCDTLCELAETTPYEDVHQKLLELIGAWNFAFRKSTKHGGLKDKMVKLKSGGRKLPQLRKTDALFRVESTPEWAAGDSCYRCHIFFGILEHKHHCRACNQAFCGQCSQKTTILKKYRTKREVRVCDACYDQATKPSTASNAAAEKQDTELPPEHLNRSLAQQNQVPPRKSDERTEAEELKLMAIAISQSEAEAVEKEKLNMVNTFNKVPMTDGSPSSVEEQLYLNHQYRELSLETNFSDKATSHLLMEPDWPSIIQLYDLIRQNDVQPKYALNAVKKKLFSQNQHTTLYALLVLENMVKNCGYPLHEELTTPAFCDTLYELAKTTPHENVRQKLFKLIQAWNFAFRKSPKHGALKDTMAMMKSDGFKFPAFRESDAMFSADSAPEWADGNVCHRCRIAFGIFQRKHHCRACGQVFCGQCLQKTTTLPKYGIEKEVRVCDACYDQATKPSAASKAAAEKQETELPPEYLISSLVQQSQTPPRKSEEELREEEELQLAIAISQLQAEAKEKEKEKFKMVNTFKVPMTDCNPSSVEEQSNPELARYLNRSYWESINQNESNEVRATSPSAPATAPLTESRPKHKENGVVDNDLEDFITTLKSQVEIFINQMKSNSSRGRSITNDTSVQTLFINITAMHSKLLRYIQQHDDSRLHFKRLQEKLTQVQETRAALDDLRDEHRLKLRLETEEAERQRQIEMAHKLKIMRKKKQEYLQFQRQLALQRIQEQEREMQMRQEHQKQQYLMGYMGANQFPQPQPPPPNTAPLFMNITAMHSKLLRNIQQHDDSRLHFKRLQEKLTKVNTFKAPVTDRNGPSLEEQSTTEPAIHLNPPDWEPSSESKFSGHTEERSSMNTFIVGKLYNTARNDNTGSEDIEWNNEKELDETVSDEKPPTSITKTATSSTSKINDDVFAQFVVVKLNQITDEAVRADVEQKIIQLLYDGLKECEKNS